MNITTRAQANAARDRITHCLKEYLANRDNRDPFAWFPYAQEARDLVFALYGYERCGYTYQRYLVWRDICNGRRDDSIDLETVLAEWI